MQWLCGNGREVKRFIYTASIMTGKEDSMTAEVFFIAP
jgi:hypothetical protein